MGYIATTMSNLLHQTAFLNLTWGNYLMMIVAFVFLYLAIKHDFEPLLLVPIAFGMLLVNIYPEIMSKPYVDPMGIEHAGGLLHYFYILDEASILPSLIFMGVGAMTDFGPLIANPISLVLGAAAQLGIYCAFIFANATGLFTPQQAASIGVIGGAVKVTASVPGKVFKVNATPGQTVKSGDPIITLEAMKMEIPVVAPQDGTLASIEVASGDAVENGQLLATMN